MNKQQRKQTTRIFNDTAHIANKKKNLLPTFTLVMLKLQSSLHLPRYASV